jgi:hypothetical protein
MSRQQICVYPLYADKYDISSNDLLVQAVVAATISSIRITFLPGRKYAELVDRIREYGVCSAREEVDAGRSRKAAIFGFVRAAARTKNATGSARRVN